MSKFWVITKQVYKRHVKTKSFLISLLIPLILGAVVIAIPKMIEYFGSDDSAKIAVLSDNPVFSQALEQNKEHFKLDKKNHHQKGRRKSAIEGKN
ncbi:ABC transporter permease [Listeria floridensis FSL S10-1187]|uniref:ABC transporter permease n=1 Tax=Listeria floridensis FSL S10-1187 TaxID=1265817 RepID=A0ABN0RFF4_9LIST|nr:ABC transporter permease [Listeria floridensis FSL S10-1187]